MARLSVRWLLTRQSVFILILVGCLAPLLPWFCILCLQDPGWLVLGLVLLPFGVGLFVAIGLPRLIVIAIWNLVRLNQHPCLQRLSRYGPVKPLVDQIERELADRSGVVRIGSAAQSLQLFGNPDTALYDAEVWLAPSWLIYIPSQGTDLVFFRFDSLLTAQHDGLTLNLLDRFEVHWQIPGTVDGLTRLAAEILVRVPWVHQHFAGESEHMVQIQIADSSVAADVLQSRDAQGPMEP